MTELVSVVVPTHDRPALLRDAVASVLAQRDVDIEVIVVDDASSTPAAVDDPRVRVLRRDVSGGPSAARNTGIDAALGAWVAFCDDDDLWAPDKLCAQLDAVAQDPDAAWSCTGCVMVDERLDVVDHARPPASGDVLPALLDANAVPGGGSSALVRTDVLRALGGFEATRRHSEDWDLWLRVAQRSPLAAVDRPLVAYRIWSGGATRGTGSMHRSWDDLMTRYGHLRPSTAGTAKRDRHERWLAKQELRAGRRVGAAQRYLSAARAGGGAADIARAAVALAAPAYLDRKGSAQAAARVPEAWRAEVATWLGVDGKVA